MFAHLVEGHHALLARNLEQRVEKAAVLDALGALALRHHPRLHPVLEAGRQ